MDVTGARECGRVTSVDVGRAYANGSGTYGNVPRAYASVLATSVDVGGNVCE